MGSEEEKERDLITVDTLKTSSQNSSNSSSLISFKKLPKSKLIPDSPRHSSHEINSLHVFSEGTKKSPRKDRILGPATLSESDIIEKQKLSSGGFFNRGILSPKNKTFFKTARKSSLWPTSKRNKPCKISRDYESNNSRLPASSFKNEIRAINKDSELKSQELRLRLLRNLKSITVDLYSEYSKCRKFLLPTRMIIGEGASASVWRINGKGSTRGKVFAVKEFRERDCLETEAEYYQKVLTEFTIASSLQHPNIVQTFRLCISKGRWSQVMEYCEQGDLFDLVKQNYLAGKDRLSDRLCLFKQLIQGLHYLHSNGIAHCDVKLENLLITQKSNLKITDFGISRVVSGTYPGIELLNNLTCQNNIGVTESAYSIRGSLPYIAPECITQQKEYDSKPLDVWAAAVVMLCLISNGFLWSEAKAGSSPFYNDLISGWAHWKFKHFPISDEISSCSATTTTQENFTSPATQRLSLSSPALISAADYPHVPFLDNFVKPPVLRRILLTMLNPEPQERASISSLVNNRWLRNVECCVDDNSSTRKVVVDAVQGKCFPSGDYHQLQRIVCHNHLAHKSNWYLKKLWNGIS